MKYENNSNLYLLNKKVGISRYSSKLFHLLFELLKDKIQKALNIYT